ncbi:MAG TPA: cytochrome c, partial [Myxococcota bacterium]|nr:cytochrome c [Myxococcota bacterium]
MMANACRIGRPRRFGAAWAALLCALLVAAPAGAPEAGEGTLVPEGADTPAGVYARACASCHGTDGRGMPRAHVGFDVPLPDFTDCSFATREPDSDWFAVAHEGGPARAFDHRMPAFGEALGTGRLEMAVAHVRTFCPERGWPSGNLNLPRAMFTEKAFVEDEAVLTVGAAYDMQKDVAYGNYPSRSDIKDYDAWTVDAFMEYPSASGVYTLSGAYFDYDTGNAFNMNPDPSLPVNSNLKGYYVKAGYMLPNKVGVGRLQFFARHETADYGAKTGVTEYYDNDRNSIGVNYYIDGQKLKVTFEYAD